MIVKFANMCDKFERENMWCIGLPVMAITFRHKKKSTKNLLRLLALFVDFLGVCVSVHVSKNFCVLVSVLAKYQHFMILLLYLISQISHRHTTIVQET